MWTGEKQTSGYGGVVGGARRQKVLKLYPLDINHLPILFWAPLRC